MKGSSFNSLWGPQFVSYSPPAHWLDPSDSLVCRGIQNLTRSKPLPNGGDIHARTKQKNLAKLHWTDEWWWQWIYQWHAPLRQLWSLQTCAGPMNCSCPWEFIRRTDMSDFGRLARYRFHLTSTGFSLKYWTPVKGNDRSNYDLIESILPIYLWRFMLMYLLYLFFVWIHCIGCHCVRCQRCGNSQIHLFIYRKPRVFSQSFHSRDPEIRFLPLITAVR